MLRFTLLLLLIANAGYFAWGQGWMAQIGWAPEVQSEAFRLQQQVRPEVLQIAQQATASDAAPAPEAPKTARPSVPPQMWTEQAQPALESPAEPVAAEPVPALQAVPVIPAQAQAVPEGQCWQAGSFDEDQMQRLRQGLATLALPAASWEWVPVGISGRWMVYMGKFANEVALEKRRGELRARKISFDRAGGALEPGLSLGRFSTEEAAQRELENLADRGVRSARVVQERVPHNVYTLRLPQATAAQQRQVQALGGALQEKPLRACASG